jgi:phage gpG-like protein
VHVKGKDGVSYAEVHNAGLRAGRGKGFVMPKRRFIGDHKGYTYQEGASQAQNLQFYPFYNTL